MSVMVRVKKAHGRERRVRHSEAALNGVPVLCVLIVSWPDEASQLESFFGICRNRLIWLLFW